MERELDENRSLQELFRAITALENPDETARFFRDLCTLGELRAMAERWQVARLVDQNVSYREISRVTGASTATVTRIAHWLRYGEGGYRLLLDRLAQPARGSSDREVSPQ